MPSASSNEDAEMTAGERKQLTFVDYIEELEMAKTLTVTGLLTKFTHLKDVTSGFVDDFDPDGYSSDDSAITID